MKNRSLFRWAATLALGCMACFGALEYGHSQDRVEAVANPVTPIEQLMALKAANAKLLEAQGRTLQKLEDLKATSDQIRIMTKRS